MQPSNNNSSRFRFSQNQQQTFRDANANMLTGDENIVKAPFAVQWKINDPAKYLFNLRNPQTTIQKVAESAMREIVGQTPIQPILNESRRQIEQDVKKLVQDTLDAFESGILITEVQLQNVD